MHKYLLSDSFSDMATTSHHLSMHDDIKSHQQSMLLDLPMNLNTNQYFNVGRQSYSEDDLRYRGEKGEEEEKSELNLTADGSSEYLSQMMHGNHIHKEYSHH